MGLMDLLAEDRDFSSQTRDCAERRDLICLGAQELFLCFPLSTSHAPLVLLQKHIKAVLSNKVKGLPISQKGGHGFTKKAQ